MTYVVAGVSGNTGSVVANTLLDAGKRVRVVVRDASKGEVFRARGAEVAVADLADPDALAAALEGAAGAYLLIPPNFGAAEFLATAASVTESIAAAVSASRVPHVVFLSSIAAHLPAGTGPILAVARAEQRLRAVPTTHFTFLRPAYFLENLASSFGAIEQGTFPTFLRPEVRFPMIATKDIGLVAARALVEGATTSSVVELAGPVDLSVEEVARVVGTVVAKDLRVEAAPTSVMAGVLVSHGMGPDLARLYVELTDALNAGRIVREGGHRFERGTTTLETVARGLLSRG